jgi:thioredoxin reductase (NADPH)
MMNEHGPQHYEVAIVGGGPAGLQTALYTARLGHDTVVFDRGGGRAAMMLDTHNVIGVEESVSGNEFLQTAREQVTAYGADVVRELITDAEQTDGGWFQLTGAEHTVTADVVVLGMGFTDGRPDPPVPRTGRGLHWCLHCDAYMFIDRPVFVMGAGEAAAKVAMIMLNFTDRVDILLRGDQPTWSEETATQLAAHPIDIIPAEITGMQKDDSGWLTAFEFDDGQTRRYRGGFPMYGSEFNSALADQLGCELNEADEVIVDANQQTTAEGVYAVGDLTPGNNQIPIAMGKGATAGLSIHSRLRSFPRDLAEIETNGPVRPSEVPGLGERIHAAAEAFPEARAPPMPEISDAVSSDD